jgi:hypothetical protein
LKSTFGKICPPLYIYGGHIFLLLIAYLPLEQVEYPQLRNTGLSSVLVLSKALSPQGAAHGVVGVLEKVGDF